MNCQGCGRVLKSQSSIELGYGPVCYKKIYGGPVRIRKSGSTSSATEDFPYYDIPGQMTLDDYLKADEEK